MCIAALKQVRSYVHLIAYLHAVLDLLVFWMLKLGRYAVKASALNMQQCHVIQFVFHSPSLVVYTNNLSSVHLFESCVVFGV